MQGRESNTREVGDMRERLERRLQGLQAEFERGQQTLEELETQAASVRQTLLRIDGAIQVLRETLDEDSQQQNGSASSAEETANEAGKAFETTR